MVNIGADFGDRAPGGGFTEAGLEIAQKASGLRALNDVHGLMAFRCEPQPVFLSMSGEANRISSSHSLATAFASVLEADVTMKPQQRLAYDLYAASQNEASADAQFIMLMMALETLIEPQRRAQDVQVLVDDMVQMTRDSGLPHSTKQSIIGSVKWIRQESIGQAGRRLAEQQLGDKAYFDEPVGKFFTRCYGLRSTLVHGNAERPSRDAVGLRAAHLQTFVCDLIVAIVLNDGE
ncbi:hypothetical protein [Pseudokineococcus sp. 1T1Z-3]|uniref:hypothetical protein n=1 Tax=Pseudokineococcus sp. 1T1Z-3 TaxID=3132745 RepID=UPI0030AC03E5